MNRGEGINISNWLNRSTIKMEMDASRLFVVVSGKNKWPWLFPLDLTRKPWLRNTEKSLSHLLWHWTLRVAMPLLFITSKRSKSQHFLTIHSFFESIISNSVGGNEESESNQRDMRYLPKKKVESFTFRAIPKWHINLFEQAFDEAIVISFSAKIVFAS